MYFDGDLNVLRNLFRKKRLMDSGDTDACKYRLLIVVGSGLQRGVIGGGHLCALTDFGLKGVFNVSVGISTGAPLLGFFLAGQIKEHNSIYWHEAVTPNFIGYSRLWKGGAPIVDVGYISKVFREKMDQKALIGSRTSFHVGLTRADNGKGELLDAKTVDPDPVEAIRASCTIPRLSGQPVTINGVDYLDGAVGCGMPIREAIDKFHSTDILILPNCLQDEKEAWWKTPLGLSLVLDQSIGFQKAFLGRHRAFNESIEYLRYRTFPRWAIVWSGTDIGCFERDPHKLELAAAESKRQLKDILRLAQQDVEVEHQRRLAAE